MQDLHASSRITVHRDVRLWIAAADLRFVYPLTLRAPLPARLDPAVALAWPCVVLRVCHMA